MRACFGSNEGPGGPPGSHKLRFSSHSTGKKKVDFPVVGHGHSQTNISSNAKFSQAAASPQLA